MKECLDRDLSVYLKGIAIILMVLHHAFGAQNYYVGNISYPCFALFDIYIARFGGFAVVPLFLFLTGYTYYKHIDKSFKYSLKKITLFLVDYWLVLLIYGIISIYICGYQLSFVGAIREMFGIERNIMRFAWYVPLYIIIMLLLPFMSKYIDRKKDGLFFLFTFFIVAISWVIAHNTDNNSLTFITKEIIVKHVPIAILGYYFAKKNYLNILYNKININSLKIVAFLFLFIVFHTVFYNLGKYILVPVYIILIKKLHLNYKSNIGKVVMFLARHSMNIWFFHCLFFAVATRDIFQKYAFIFHNPILVVCWILFICSILSMVITPVQDSINKQVSKLFI